MVPQRIADWIEREIGLVSERRIKIADTDPLACDVIGAASRRTTSADRKRDEIGCGAATFRKIGCVVDSQ